MYVQGRGGRQQNHGFVFREFKANVLNKYYKDVWDYSQIGYTN